MFTNKSLSFTRKFISQKARFPLFFNVRSYCLPLHKPEKWKVLFFGTDNVSLPTLTAMFAHPNLVSDIAVICPPDTIKECKFVRSRCDENL